MICAHCGKPVDPSNYCVRVQGWEPRGFKGASRRGGSDIVLRERLKQFACDGCIFKLKHGLSTEQESLL